MKKKTFVVRPATSKHEGWVRVKMQTLNKACEIVKQQNSYAARVLQQVIDKRGRPSSFHMCGVGEYREPVAISWGSDEVMLMPNGETRIPYLEVKYGKTCFIFEGKKYSRSRLSRVSSTGIFGLEP